MRNLVLALSVVAAGLSSRLGLLDVAVPASPAPKAAAQKQPAEKSKSLPEDHPISVLYEYFDPTYDDAKSPEVRADLSVHIGDRGKFQWQGKLTEQGDDSGGACEDIGGWPHPGHVRYLVATLPDPDTTHLSQEFDRGLESIIAAATAAGYVYDRYWLPWRRQSEASAGPDAASGEDRAAARQKRPGLLLFRDGTDGKAKTLAVFLVGEQPTAGIDRYQFRNALCYIGRLSAGGTASPWEILGPFSSGSLDSLVSAVQEARGRPETPAPKGIWIISGTATSGDAINAARERVKGMAKLDVVQQPDKHVMEAALKHLRARRVAILSEGNTVYGDQFSGERRYVWISYPRDISYLRNAYQESEAAAGEASARGVGLASKQLPLSLKDRREGGDSVPQFDTAHLPVVQETVLLRIADRLKRRAIDTAVLTGTNVFDLLFLSKFLKEACPDVRLVLLDWHLLFVHGADTREFTGVVVASTFPPFYQTGERIAAPAPRIFLSQLSRGVFEGMLRFVAPGLAAPPGDAWLSVIGRDDFWPVSRMNSWTLPYFPRPPRAAWVVHSAIQFCFLVFGALCILAGWRNQPVRRWAADLHPAPDGERTPHGRTYYLLLMLAFLLAVQVVFAAGILVATWDMFSAGELGFWMGRGLPLLATLTLCAAIVVYLRARDWHPAWLLVGCVPALVAASAILAGGSGELYLRAYRSAHITSGAGAALAPALLLLALAWWSWTQALRFVIAEDRRHSCPDFGEPAAGAAFEHLKAAWPGWWRSEHRKVLSKLGAIVQGVVFILVILMAAGVVRSFETSAFDWLFIVLLALVSACLAGTTFEFLLGWLNLRRYLESLDLHPTRKDLQNLPQVPLWSLMWQASARKRSHTLQKRTAECLLKLRTFKESYGFPGLDSKIESFRNGVESVLAQVSAGDRESRADVEQLREDELSLDKGIIERLRIEVWEEGSSESLERCAEHASNWCEDESPGEIARDKVHVLAGEYLALRITAFIRYILLHLRNLFSVLTVVFILLTMGMLAYPFQGDSLFRGLTFTLFIVEAVVTLTVFLQMERDATLRRLTTTPEGKLQRDFLLPVLSAGAMPVLAMLASLFPALRGFLLGWVQPALAALH
ncbi:MAG: hypothetical protein HZB13_21000 [Acidobacteria bacterium]|nr:hypothetical protein [Acidobacteriota bacterium]